MESPGLSQNRSLTGAGLPPRAEAGKLVLWAIVGVMAFALTMASVSDIFLEIWLRTQADRFQFREMNVHSVRYTGGRGRSRKRALTASGECAGQPVTILLKDTMYRLRVSSQSEAEKVVPAGSTLEIYTDLSRAGGEARFHGRTPYAVEPGFARSGNPRARGLSAVSLPLLIVSVWRLRRLARHCRSRPQASREGSRRSGGAEI